MLLSPTHPQKKEMIVGKHVACLIKQTNIFIQRKITQGINSSVYIGIHNMACAHMLQASNLVLLNKYFHMSTNNTGYQYVRTRLHQHVIFTNLQSFPQPQSKCLLLLISTSGNYRPINYKQVLCT
jgi:hypothetical protein